LTRIPGISAFHHEGNAYLLVDGRIVAAAQEEREGGSGMRDGGAWSPRISLRSILGYADGLAMTWLAAMLTAFLVMVGDQVSKAFVLSRQPVPLAVRRPFISIQCMLNPRGALAPFLGASALLVMWVAAVVLALLVLTYGAADNGVMLPIGIGAVIGGAAGNLLDRVRRGAIVDFIAVGPWPVFNLADAAIVAGIGLALLSLG